MLVIDPDHMLILIKDNHTAYTITQTFAVQTIRRCGT
jgi:hypothetical protein